MFPTQPRRTTRLAVLTLGLLSAGLISSAGAQSLDQRKTAVRDTITNNSGNGEACSIAFYWEIGDQNGKLDSGSKGIAPNANSEFRIYSAGKWLYGAYVYQKRGGVLTPADKDALRMRSGYNDSADCLLNTTVAACQATLNTYTAADDTNNAFYYGGGHFQKHAVTEGLGSKTKPQLATELRSQLDTPDGADTNVVFTFSTPVLASGYRSTPAAYAVFLRKLLSGTLLLSGGLGSDAVCTYPVPGNPGGRTTCANARYSPMAPVQPGISETDTGANEMASYSIGHWVEDDPFVGDGAFSSPGAAGFYPWIDASRQWYGIIARNVLTAESSKQSVDCGRLLRKAWVHGVAQ